MVGLMVAVIEACKLVMQGLPNIEMTSFLIILFTLRFPRLTCYVVPVFTLIEGMIYGFGLWWFGYCYLWPLLVLVVNSLRRWSHPLLWTVVAGLFGLLFGPLGSLPEFVAGGWAWGLSYIISGIPFDLAHCVSNVVLVLVLYAPLEKLLKRLLPAS